ncbi:MAG: cytochrome c oxidase assembly protein [Bryobacteraceae bacterium]
MDPLAAAILASWRLDVRLVAVLLVVVWLYVRGWRKLHRESPRRYTVERRAAFLAGLTLVFLALASPLDAFGALLLEVHMIQHLLLIMVAPPLIWSGQPVIPILRGLPQRFFKDGLGPFLRWHALQRVGRAVTHPVICWLAMAFAVVFWHIPRWYELALHSQAWHELEHACFFYAALLFWWPVIQVWPSRRVWPRWMMIPYLVLADMVNTGLSAWLVFSNHVIYRTYELAPRLGDSTALSDQSTAGAIMWVPGSIVYLIPALILTMGALTGRRSRPLRAAPIKPVPRKPASAPWDLLRLPALGRIFRYRHFRRIVQALLFVIAVALVIDGLFGPQIAPLNLAGVLPWTYWRGFAIVALLTAGNFFCMACPFMLPRDLARRFLPARHRWPARLRSKWTALVLLALYLWAYEVFAIWSSPWWTAWIVIGYFVTAFLVDGFFEGASFCKYVCLIGQFHFVNSLVSPLEVKVRSAAVCGSCRTYDCIRGNQDHRGCELQLFQPQKKSNFDCTFCLDCVHACPQDNVGILAVVPGKQLIQDRLLRRADVAALALVLVFGAFVNAAGMLDPVMLWIHRLRTPHMTTVLLIAGLLLGPALAALACGWAGRWLGNSSAPLKEHVCSFALALVPLGLAMWVAHFASHLVVGWGSAQPVIDRLFHLSRSVKNFSATAPDWLAGAQILLLDGGLILTLYLAWRIASRRTEGASRAFGLVMPWAILAVCLYAAGIWILFQPMQMRGMVMT